MGVKTTKEEETLAPDSTQDRLEERARHSAWIECVRELSAEMVFCSRLLPAGLGARVLFTYVSKKE